MPPHKCAYFRCNNTSDKKSMFRFPWNEPDRLGVWLDNCGNMSIAHLTPERLRSRYLCIDHFSSQYVISGHRKTLLRTAIPEPYKIPKGEEHPALSTFNPLFRFDLENDLAMNSPLKPCAIQKEMENADKEDRLQIRAQGEGKKNAPFRFDPNFFREETQTTFYSNALLNPTPSDATNNDVEACRICLATDVKMYLLEDFTQEMDYIAALLNTTSYMPKYICYECAPTFMKFNKLVQKSRIVQETLASIYAMNGMVTKSLIQKKDRTELKLESSLKIAYVNLYVGNDSIDTDTEAHAGKINFKNEEEIVVETVQQNEVDPLELLNTVKMEIDDECSDTESQELALKNFDEVEPDVENVQLIEKTEENHECVHNNINRNDNANFIQIEVEKVALDDATKQIEVPVEEVASDNATKQIDVPVEEVASDNATNRSFNSRRTEVENRAEALQKKHLKRKLETAKTIERR